MDRRNRTSRRVRLAVYRRRESEEEKGRKRGNLKRLYQDGGVTGREEGAVCAIEIEKRRFAASLPGRELYARVDPFGQIAATNFKKNMPSPSHYRLHPRSYPPAPPSFRRTLMRKISKRRSSSRGWLGGWASLNRQQWSGCRYYRIGGGFGFDLPQRRGTKRRVVLLRRENEIVSFREVQFDRKSRRIRIICRKD